MINLRYNVYYRYDGPCKADPLRQQKDADEIAWALERVKNDLEIRLDDANARVTTRYTTDRASINLSISTGLSEELALDAVKKCLAGLDLCGVRLAD